MVEAEQPARGWPLIAREGLVVLLFVLLAVLETGIARDFSTRYFVTPDATDDLWVLHWVAEHMFADPRRVFDANAFFPSRSAVLYCEPLVGPALLVQPVRLLTTNPIALYNSAMLLALVSASVGFYALARRMGADWRAAILAGIVVSYSPQQTAHFTHLNMLTISGFAALLLALLRLMEAPGPLPAALAAFAFAFEACTSGYHAFTGAFLSLIVAAWSARSLLRPKTLFWSAVAAALAFVLVWPYVSAFTSLKASEQMTRGVSAASHFSVDFAATFSTTNGRFWSTLLPWARDGAFPGILVPLLALAGVLRSRSRHKRLALVVFLVFFLLSLGPSVRFGGRGLFRLPTIVLYDHLPFFDAIRHPITFLVPAWIGLGVLAALGASALGLTRTWPSSAVLLTLAAAETLIVPPARVARQLPVPAIYDALRSAGVGPTLVLPIEDFQEDVRYWSIYHRIPLVNGQGAFEPQRYGGIYRVIHKRWNAARGGPLDDDVLNMFLTHYPVRYVVVHSWASRALRQNVEATPDVFEKIRQTDDGDRLYRVRRRGRGVEIRRAFREDQLVQRRIALTLVGPAGARVDVGLGGRTIAGETLTGERQTVEIDVPPPAPGMNLFVLKLADPGTGDMVLEDIEAR